MSHQIFKMISIFFQISFGRITAEFIYRFAEALFEIYHQKERFHNRLSIKKICEQIFSCNKFCLKLIPAIIIAFSFSGLKSEDIFGYDFIFIIATNLIWRFAKLFESNFFEIKQFIRNDDSLDYGSSMAISYFYGYLKIVLPSSEEVDSKSIFERIDDYSDSHNVNFPDKRLFILLPSSMHISNKLTECSDILECAKPLEKILRNRAGIIKRSYHTCVYKIKKERFWHIAVEGASPLLTYFEAMKYEEKLRENRSEIFDSFYRTLKKCLENDELCKDKCCLIRFNESDGNDIGELLYNQIKDKIISLD